MRWQTSIPNSHRKNILSSHSSISPEKFSVMAINQISTLFFLVVLGGEHKQFVQADCSSQIGACPFRKGFLERYSCMAGEKKYEDIFPGVNTGEISGQECTNDDCAYCDCDEESHRFVGYTGLKCETKFEICADGHVCFHGAPCVVTNTGEYICDCHGSADIHTTFLGDHCEYKADSVCAPSPEDSFDSPAFCTNNGKCREGIGNPFDKCECEKGFYGLHCEFKYDPSCEISCKNGGFCNRGVKIENEYDDGIHNDDDFNQQASASYCVCRNGWEGEECQSENNCNCRNGSTCHHFENSDSYCDCSTTILSQSTGAKVLFAGLQCESKITTMCPGQQGHPDSEYFCTNGGRCPTEPHLPCVCPVGLGFSGPRCEFKGTATKVCSLPCENGGTCFFGNKPNDFLGDYGKSQMQCKCPKGYTGILCQLPVDICDAGEHHCLNNGKCVKDGEDYNCDCSTAVTNTIHAGEHCEHEATSFCLGPGDALGDNVNAFCTNHGTCKELVSTTIHSGCDCESPFYGDYCEKGATLEQTLEIFCDGPGGFSCYNHGTCKELPGASPALAHPGCVCEPPYFGDLCQFKSNNSKDGTAGKVFVVFTICVFGLLTIFFLTVFLRRKTVSNRHVDHTPIGVPPEVHVHALDLDTANDNTEIMGTGYDDKDDDEKEILENVYIS